MQYINVTGQDCRDLWGVQVVVIEGIPCQTETYKVITCVSLATQDDVFVPLENLKPGAEYLLNIDGYLHDFCSFNMELSLEPKGMPIVQEIQVERSNHVKKDTVFYSWQTPDTLLNSITRYDLYRRKAHEVKFKLLKSFETKMNAYDQVKKEFHFSEIITDADIPWTYKLVGETGKEYMVMDVFRSYPDWGAKISSRYRIWLDLDFADAAALKLQVIDYLTGNVLEEMSFDYDPKSSYKVSFDLSKSIKSGIKHFQIVARSRDADEVKRYDYEYVNNRLERMR